MRINRPLIASVALALGGITGCSKPAAPTASQETLPQRSFPVAIEPAVPKPSEAPAKADFTLPSIQFSEEYKKDEKAFKEKYRGKWVELTGEVKGYLVRYDPTLPGVLWLEGSKQSILGVHCDTTDSMPCRTAAPGQVAKILGYVPQDVFTDIVIQCKILEATGPKPLAFTPDQMVEVWAGNDGKTRDRLQALGSKTSYLLVTGEVVEVIVGNSGRPNVMLKHKPGAKPARVFLDFSQEHKKLAEKIKPGMKVEALGEFVFGEDYVSLHDSALLSPLP